METTNYKALAAAYIQAVGDKRFDTVASLLHPEAEFGFGDTVHETVGDKEGYVASLRRLGQILLRNDIRHLFAEGDAVCVVYDFVTDTPAGAVPCVEWLTMRDGLIGRVKLMFERDRWHEVLGELQRRVSAAKANR